MLNTVALQGRLVADPELKKVGSGDVSQARLTIAVDRNFVAQGKERETDFIDCTAWRGTADFIAKYFTKGQLIVVNGSIQTYVAEKEGQKRKYTKVIVDQANFGGSKGENSGGNNNAKAEQPAAPAASGGNLDDFSVVDDDEDLPF